MADFVAHAAAASEGSGRSKKHEVLRPSVRHGTPDIGFQISVPDIRDLAGGSTMPRTTRSGAIGGTNR